MSFSHEKHGKALRTKSFLNNVGDSQDFLLLFDVHWDNPKSDHELLKRHLKEAKDRDAKILFGGDLFCVMQGRYDPRRSRSGIRPEHDTTHYLDAVIDTAVEFFAPYAEQIIFIGHGNHEASVSKNNETSVIDRFAEGIRQSGGHPVVGGIGCWWLFGTCNSNGTRKHMTPAFFHHGSGGGGPVTKGVIQTNRRAVYLPDAKFIFTGHIHEKWQVTTVRDRINTNTGEFYLDEQVHVCVPTYKQEYAPDTTQFHDILGRPPKPLGGVWFTQTYMGRQKTAATAHQQNGGVVIKNEIRFTD